MSKPIVHYQMLFTITTLISTLVYNYVVLPCQRRQERELDNLNMRFETLMDKIHKLEDSIVFLQRSIEDIEEKIDRKNNRVIESHTVLSSKLDDFINYSYDLYEDG